MGLFKDFVKNIGGIAKDSVLSGLAKGIHNAQLKANLTSSGDAESGWFYNDTSVSADKDFSLFGIVNSINSKNYKTYKQFNKYIQFDYTRPYSEIERKDYEKRYDDVSSEYYYLTLPLWSYGDFINERNIFIKHLSNGLDEPGWFYFKVFFDFSTNHGLFGGILTSDSDLKNFVSINSATDYMIQCKELFKYEKITERMICLQRFTKLLSYININAPWFFKSVKNLSQASKPRIDNITEEQSIELELDQDAVDMRISTLMSLYKYACYDDINNKEILPENLRKFDMCVLVFSAPIKFIHNTHINNGYGYKSLYHEHIAETPEGLMSFKLYKFLNCEIDIDSIGGFMGDEANNEQPFALGKNTIKIKYDKSYEYLMNEYMGLMFGSDGIYLNNPNITVGDVKDLTILSEEKIHDNINQLLKGNSRFVLGNIFNQNKQIYERKVSDNVNSKSFTDKAKGKFGLMNNNKNMILNLGYNMLYKWLGTGYNANAEVIKAGKQVIGDGTALNGHGNYRVGSAVWYAKMRRLLKGTTDLSNREIRLGVTGQAFYTDWFYNLQNRALNAVQPIT